MYQEVRGSWFLHILTYRCINSVLNAIRMIESSSVHLGAKTALITQDILLATASFLVFIIFLFIIFDFIVAAIVITVGVILLAISSISSVLIVSLLLAAVLLDRVALGDLRSWMMMHHIPHYHSLLYQHCASPDTFLSSMP